MSGRLIVIEGIDGSGKGTQAARLHARLNQAGCRTALLSFPRYQQTEFGRQIGRFLNGGFGSLDQVHPLLASLLFAGDRWESRSLLLESLAQNDVVVCDRYVASNIAHQASKRTGTERRELIEWIERLEFQLYQLPRAELTIWLDLPVPVARQLIARKAQRTYTEKSADLQEADGEYLQQVREVYAELAAGDPSWRRIDGLASGQLRAVEDIATEIMQVVRSGFNVVQAERRSPPLPNPLPRDGGEGTEESRATRIAAASPSAMANPQSAIRNPQFGDLVTSRKTWLADVLQPWCRAAARKDLLLAEQEWLDIAGKVDAEATLWRWAWSRFPELVHEHLGIEETSEVVLKLRNGQEIRGFPDSRQSRRGMLMLLTTNENGRFVDAGPFSLDDVTSVRGLATIDPVTRAVP